MKYQLFIQWLALSFLAFATSAEDTAPIPERYTSEYPKIGYFGRMEKVLYSSNATDTTIATNMIIKKVFDLMGMKSEVQFYENVNNLKIDLAENRVDGVFVNIIDYFSLEHLINTDYIYALTLGPEIYEKTLLITHNDLKIAKLEDLRGHSITIPIGHHLGKKYLDLELMKRGLPKSENFFAKIRQTVDINSAILDLFFGKTDCALATDVAFKLTSELNKQITKEIDILLTSNQMIPQIIALNKNISEATIKKVDRNIVNAHNNQYVKHLLSLFRAKKIIKLRHKQLDENRRFLAEYQTLEINRELKGENLDKIQQINHSE